MRQPLARVLDPDALDGPRGADATFAIEVPREWLSEGGQLVVLVPRKAACARCEGGGCDACGRGGVVVRASAAEEIAVALPASETGVRLRLPGLGGEGEVGLPRGHLLLDVRPSDRASTGVRTLAREPALALAVSPGGYVRGPRTTLALACLMALGVAIAAIASALRLKSRASGVRRHGSCAMAHRRGSSGPASETYFGRYRHDDSDHTS